MFWNPFRNLATRRQVEKLETFIMTTQAELTTVLNQVNAQVRKIAAESSTSLQKIQQLQDQLANDGNLTPEAENALSELKASLQSLDNLVADVPATPDTPVVETGTVVVDGGNTNG